MGDVVVGLNGHQIRTQAQFMEELARLRPGDRATLDIIRYGQRLRKTVELGEFESASAPVAQRTQRPRAEELLGFSVMQVTPEMARRVGLNGRGGVAVREVDPLSPAATAVRPGLLIQKLNGRDITSTDDVERIAGSLRPGQVVTIVARRPDEAGSEIILNYRVR